MNIKGIRRRAGFTLIELLVVITIIAVLAGLAMPAFNVVMRKARETKARAVIAGLVTAIKEYQTEYNRLPANATGDRPTADVTDLRTDAGCGVLKALLMKSGDATALALNPRQIKFYEPPLAKDGRGGLTPNGDLYDPFTKVGDTTPIPYYIGLDYDGDGEIQNPLAGFGNEPQKLSASVIVYSSGNDGAIKTKDDLKSW